MSSHYYTDAGLGKRRGFDSALTGPCFHDPDPVDDDRLEPGDRVELPWSSTFEVIEAHYYDSAPDRYEVAELDGTKEITWREHHIENALEGGARVLEDAGTGERFDVLDC